MERERTDRQYYPAINPEDGKPFQLAITHRRARFVALRGEGAVREMARLIPQAVLSFKHIWEGIRWEEDEDQDRESDSDGWLCYCAQPTTAYAKDGREIAAWRDEFLLVFVNREKVIYHWRWDECDPADSSRPVGWSTRFHKMALGAGAA